MFEYKNKTDEEVVSYVQSEYQEFYFVIVDRYKDKLSRYVGSMTKDEVKTRDIVQETFIKAFINLRGFDKNKKFSSWIYRIAHNEAINTLKKNYREIPFEEDFDIKSEEDIVLDFEKKEISKKLDKCINDMPLIYRESLVLYFIEEKSYEEISDIIRIPMGTVATRINRAKILMKKICQKN
ncbi:TPA: RNA polymerase sigma factor [Candidatus Nomurabacteria bacterium]|nr:MAG: RNA polymerase, sigma-24 subunit, ECF subfamily [Parcubacteria bacterium RAAC4_OD1_1]HCY26154.1 RNA polymerase sigma factor [Candidatus Nomurabacteria bacterium]